MGSSPGSGYEQRRARLARGGAEDRLAVATDRDAEPEFLFLLARDQDPAVRRAVAAHDSTPVHAAPILAGDTDEQVRLALMRRLTRLLPDLSGTEQARLLALATAALDRLARDHSLRVRTALAATLKDTAYAPNAIAMRLAQDSERAVAEPILKLSQALSDRDLLQLIAAEPPPWKLRAIAQRQGVSSAVAAALVATGDVPATGALVDNHSAEISEETMIEIVELARRMVERAPELQAAVSRRPGLSQSLRRRLAALAEESVDSMLRETGELDPETAAEVAQVVQRRLAFDDTLKGQESPLDRAERLHRAQRLDDDAVSDALAMNDRAFAEAAIALLARVPPGIVKRILNTKSPKPVTALAWRAGLSMRTAMQMQSRLAGIAPARLLNARGGFDFPLEEDDMRWQLEFFGIL